MTVSVEHWAAAGAAVDSIVNVEDVASNLLVGRVLLSADNQDVSDDPALNHWSRYVLGSTSALQGLPKLNCDRGCWFQQAINPERKFKFIGVPAEVHLFTKAWWRADLKIWKRKLKWRDRAEQCLVNLSGLRQSRIRNVNAADCYAVFDEREVWELRKDLDCWVLVVAFTDGHSTRRDVGCCDNKPVSTDGEAGSLTEQFFPLKYRY